MSARGIDAAQTTLGRLWVDWRNTDDAGRRQITRDAQAVAKGCATIGGWPEVCSLFDDFERTHGVEAAAWLDARWTGFEHRGGVWGS